MQESGPETLEDWFRQGKDSVCNKQNFKSSVSRWPPGHSLKTQPEIAVGISVSIWCLTPFPQDISAV